MRARTLAFLLLLFAGCKTAPTTVLLRIEAATGLPYPDELRLSVFTEAGVAISGEKLRGATLPGELVLYPPASSGVLRLLCRASSKGSTVGEGTTSVELRAGEQTQATVLVKPGALPDGDGDGIPDAIDGCPTIANPAQGLCPKPDAALDLPPDLGPGDRSAREAGPSDLPVDHAVDRHADLLVCSCALGCVTGTTTCRSLVPANGFTASSYTTLAGGYTNLLANTTSCELSDAGTSQILAKGGQPPGSTACVIALDSLTIKNGATLRAIGSYPLVLLIKKNIAIQGTLDLGGHGNEPGAGGGKGGVAPSGGPGSAGKGPGGGKVCGCTSALTDDCGGGGGGHGSVGGAGGLEDTCTPSSPGGASYGFSNLVPLTAGSGGASGGQASSGAPVASGGAGGGALQISCSQTLTLTGAILAGGGGGGAVTSAGSGLGLAGGGGGAGGGVLLEAASFSGNGKVVAEGGGGGGAGGTGSPSVCTGYGAPGADATELTPASGGTAVPPCGAGGKSRLAGEAGAVHGAGGGGGGGAGWIRFNWYQHKATAPFSSAGSVTTGEVVVK